MTIQVCIMSYKYAHLAAHAVESVLSQTRKPDSIVLVDDGAHDGIDRIAEKYNIECLVRENNLGIVDNFQDVLSSVETDKVMFLGADNWLRPDALELMEGADVDIVSTDIALFGTEVDSFRNVLQCEKKDGHWIWRFQIGDIEKGNYIHGSSLYNADLAKKVGGYMRNPDSRNTEEDWMLFREMLRNGATHKHIPEPLLYYRRHKNNFNK